MLSKYIYGMQISKAAPKKPVPDVYTLYKPLCLSMNLGAICEYQG